MTLKAHLKEKGTEAEKKGNNIELLNCSNHKQVLSHLFWDMKCS